MVLKSIIRKSIPAECVACVCGEKPREPSLLQIYSTTFYTVTKQPNRCCSGLSECFLEHTKGPCTDGRCLICWDLEKIWSAVGATEKTDWTCQNTCGWNKETNLNMNKIFCCFFLCKNNKILLCASMRGGVASSHPQCSQPGQIKFSLREIQNPNCCIRSSCLVACTLLTSQLVLMAVGRENDFAWI